MTIACMGWGSLVTDPRDLPRASEWHEDGPRLPVEFARQSNDGRLTLVIVEGATVSTTLWCALNVPDLDRAVGALQTREGAESERSIGRWPSPPGRNYPFSEQIGEWAAAKGFSGAVWTALKPGSRGNRGEVPTLKDVLAHLRALDAASLARAAKYIREAPPQIKTGFRPELEAELLRLG